MSEVGIGGNCHPCQRPGEFTGPKRGLTPCAAADRSEVGLHQERGKCFKGRVAWGGEKGLQEKRPSL